VIRLHELTSQILLKEKILLSVRSPEAIFFLDCRSGRINTKRDCELNHVCLSACTEQLFSH